MKIIKPSATIIEGELDHLPVYKRIDKCAAICYQRPAKPTEEQAEQFCKTMLDKGHRTPMEMVVLHLVVPNNTRHSIGSTKYLRVDESKRLKYMGDVVVTGSIRALMESINPISYIWNFLSKHYPLFFPRSKDFGGQNGVRFANFEEMEVLPEHRHVAVRFVVSRSISHQLVRHRPMAWLQESQRYCRYSDEVTFIEPEWVGEKHKLLKLSWGNHMEDCENYYRDQLERGLSPQQARGGLPNDTKTELIGYASIPQWRHVFSERCSSAADPEMRRIMTPLRDEMLLKKWDV